MELSIVQELGKKILSQSNISEERSLDIFNKIFYKQFPSSALSFIDNHSRVLSGWDDAGLLLEKTENKRKKFHFVELVWIAIIKQLRDFGVSIPDIQKIKNEMVKNIDLNKALDLAKMKDPSLLNALKLASNGLLSDEQLVQALSEVVKFQSENLRFMNAPLTTFVVLTLIFQRHVDLLWTINNECLFYQHGKSDPEIEKLYQNALNQSHISISVTNIVYQLLKEDYIPEQLREIPFTEAEITILKHVRNKNNISIKITFEKDKPQMLTVTRKTKTEAEARIKELLLTEGYAEIMIKSFDKKVIGSIKTKKYKL